MVAFAGCTKQKPENEPIRFDETYTIEYAGVIMKFDTESLSLLPVLDRRNIRAGEIHKIRHWDFNILPQDVPDSKIYLVSLKANCQANSSDYARRFAAFLPGEPVAGEKFRTLKLPKDGISYRELDRLLYFPNTQFMGDSLIVSQSFFLVEALNREVWQTKYRKALGDCAELHVRLSGLKDDEMTEIPKAFNEIERALEGVISVVKTVRDE